MLSSDDLETLIVSKKREIEREKTLLGIGTSPSVSHQEEDKENVHHNISKKVTFQEQSLPKPRTERRILSQKDENSQEKGEKDLYELEEKIPPDLQRYIRRYIGIPAMLKAGEYSPNNPALRALAGERGAGDAFLGLGEYERRRNTLRKIRQAQYRQYLDQQAKKKQEDKEQVERERKEREEKERQREERERQLLLERERYSPERRRASVSSVPITSALVQTTKVDTGVQVEGVSAPLSVAVQTDDVELYRLSPSPVKGLTQAERELSPRTVAGGREHWEHTLEPSERRRSYGDFDECTSTITKSTRRRLVSELSPSCVPGILDADGIHMRNLQAEKEAAARRQFYQQELRNQILEQQRIREERKTREKMLEQAEMRRLEEQLRMLRLAQESERDKQQHLEHRMKENTKDFDTKRTELQREIDLEQQKLLRSTSQPLNHTNRQTNTSKSDTPRSKLPFYYDTFQPIEKDKKPYSFNIPDNSVFSANYDVDSYLRKNLNFRDKLEAEIDNIGSKNSSPQNVGKNRDLSTNYTKYERSQSNNNVDFEKKTQSYSNKVERNFVTEKALIHELKEKRREKVSYDDLDNISIPVLRHSPQSKVVSNENSLKLSEAMQKVEDKWKVPAVQKNILKSLPNDQGKSVSILTQLGSIRRQLQLEQLKLDKMMPKAD